MGVLSRDIHNDGNFYFNFRSSRTLLRISRNSGEEYSKLQEILSEEILNLGGLDY
jgi:hypothetical protein